MTGPVLVVDDDRDVLHAASLALAGESERVETAPSAAELLGKLGGGTFEALLLDMNFALGEQSGQEGLSLLAQVRAKDPDLAVVLMTTYGGVALAVESLKRGAVDFVLKPWRNDKLVAAVKAAAERTRASRTASGAFDLDTAERDAIRRALARHDGNIARAASALGLTRPALYRRIAKHGL